MSDLLERAFSTKIDRSETLWSSCSQPGFLSVSLTGDSCDLNCNYCKGRYLESMTPAEEPEDLWEVCESFNSEGGGGVLLSGGYNRGGYVPLEPFLDTIARIKEDTGLFLSAHTGLAPEVLAEGLGDSGLDMVDFDLIADELTIQAQLKINKEPEDYRASFDALLENVPDVAPHILLGRSNPGFRAEGKALDMISDRDISALVFLIIIPPGDSDVIRYPIPSPEEVGEFIAEARLEFPEVPLALGCMRPKDSMRVETEKKAIEAGVDRVVLPSDETTDFARDMGLDIRRMEACCSVPEPERWSTD